MNESKSLSSVPPWAAGLFALFAVVGADIFLYGKALGVGMACYILTVLGLSHALLRPGQGFGTKALLSLGLLGLSFSFVLHASGMALLLSLVGILILLPASRGKLPDQIGGVLDWFLQFIQTGLLQWARDLSLAFKTDGLLRRLRFRGAWEWSLAIFASLIFVILFRFANPVVELGIHRLTDGFVGLLRQIPDFFSAGRLAIWLSVALLVWGLLRTELIHRIRKSSKSVEIDADKWSPSLLTKCLVVFNAVFAGETILDIGYLWGGVALPGGMSYAEYAHRGAYPLVFTATLSALLVLIAFASERSPLQKKLVILWLLQNLFLIISTVWRLLLYIKTYDLTIFRVNTILWLFLVSAGIFWIAV
ncbi:MAG: DUF4173 domain-containing protein, partial [Spirochaetia bacterium]|nr:DUF4173 domain-containing protein [Spirochaetia bacterium]